MVDKEQIQYLSIDIRHLNPIFDETQWFLFAKETACEVGFDYSIVRGW